MINYITNSTSTAAARWGQVRRLEFIEFWLTWQGAINRSELVRHFAISPQQASADFSLYQSMAEGNMVYDRSGKCYVPTDRFTPVLTRGLAADYLDQLRDACVNPDEDACHFLGSIPPTDVVTVPARAIGTTVLQELLRAIRQQLALEVTYQSMRDSAPVRQWVRPHALGFDGSRWHARVWRETQNDFADFVLSRIQRIHRLQECKTPPPIDAWWESFIDIVIKPNSKLSDAQQQAVAHEYGMKAGELTLRKRKAMAFYTIRSLRLEHDESDYGADQPLELANRDTLKEILTAGIKSLSVKVFT